MAKMEARRELSFSIDLEGDVDILSQVERCLLLWTDRQIRQADYLNGIVQRCFLQLQLHHQTIHKAVFISTLKPTHLFVQPPTCSRVFAKKKINQHTLPSICCLNNTNSVFMQKWSSNYCLLITSLLINFKDFSNLSFFPICFQAAS